MSGSYTKADARRKLGEFLSLAGLLGWLIAMVVDWRLGLAVGAFGFVGNVAGYGKGYFDGVKECGSNKP